MSEYQYYEFRAIDKPLDKAAMGDLRNVSSRAEITPTRFVNEYNYGDFRGKPAELMKEYFDAHLYLANWGTRLLMLRLPRVAVPLPTVEPYGTSEVVGSWATKSHTVIEFRTEDEDGGQWEEGEAWLDELLPLRDDLIAGDLRCLYLGWLAGLDGIEELDDDTLEPPVPPGLGRLSEPLQKFVEYLRIDSNLIEVAATASRGAQPAGPTETDIERWVGGLPATEKNRLLIRLMRGEGGVVGSELMGRFRAEQVRRSPPTESAQRRTVGALRAARERLADEKELRAAKAKAAAKVKEDQKRAVMREMHLNACAGREEELWRTAETAIGAKVAKEYERAVELLKDLRDLAARASSEAAFATRMKALRERHRTKPSLIKRLNEALLP